MSSPESRIVNRKVTRRRLLQGGTLATVGAAGVVAGVERSRWTAAIDQWSDWQSSQASNDTFFREHKTQLSNLRFGCSFSPEEFGLSPQLVGIEREDENRRVFGALDKIIDGLGIKDIRFGIRWANAIDPRDRRKFDFSFYKPFVDHCLEKGANVCLNIGPLKTFRHPEEHPPREVMENISYIPSRGQRITPDMEIAKDGVVQMIQQLEYVQDNYGENVGAFQPDNEPEQSTGQYGWIMGKKYMMSNIEIIHSHFPNAQILVNASNPDNVDDISGMFKALIRRNPDMAEKLTLGYDYYYKKPKLSDKPFLRFLDPITRAKMMGNESLKKNKQDAKKYGYNIEITEGQAEAWKPYFSPGNSAQEFRFMILRCMNEVLNMDRQSVLRIWGAEPLVRRMMNDDLTGDHDQIIDMIKRVNPQKPRLYLF